VASLDYLATLRKSVAKNHRRMAECEGSALAGEVEAIHDFRVALRRIRSALRLFTREEDDSKVHKLRKRSVEFARITGRVRDLDVHLKRARLDLADGSAPEAWVLSLAVERQTAMKAVEEMLSGKNYRRWKKKLGSWLESTPSDPGNDGLPKAIQVHVEQVASHSRAVGDEEVHALRIAIKRLRYLLEFFSKDLQPKSRAAINKLSHAQDLLGEYHDTVVGLSKLDAAISVLGDFKVVDSLREYRLVLEARLKRMSPSKAAMQVMKVVSQLGEPGV
jgi:triphosphatase